MNYKLSSMRDKDPWGSLAADVLEQAIRDLLSCYYAGVLDNGAVIDPWPNWPIGSNKKMKVAMEYRSRGHVFALLHFFNSDLLERQCRLAGGIKAERIREKYRHILGEKQNENEV